VASRILVVDDEKSIQEFLRLLLEEGGYEVTTASSMEEGRKTFFEDSFDLVLCDIIMPDGNGLDLLQEMKAHNIRSSVIMMTAYTSTKSAIDAMKRGAYDYISKPFDVEELKVIVQKALEKTELVDENVYLRRELEQKYQFSNIIGRSNPMKEIFALIERVARTSSTVLLEGESGTGKELIARAIHYQSPRSSHRFLSVNCGALPENLLESELFGHERGSFTGAVRQKKGLFREAHLGSLFLDEIGEMSLAMQVKLLRALQEKKVRRVGGHQEEPVDTRIRSTSFPSACRRCASAGRIFRCWWTTSSRRPARRWESSPKEYRWRPCGCSRATSGPAMCASWRMSSSAHSPFRPART
jgi:DNA-binding NtrC family response regulator